MVYRAELVRVEKSDEGTLGVLRLDGQAFCVTLEPPDKGNAANLSCIPAGRYECRRVVSPRYGETYEVCDVPDRSHILFHPGNVSGDTMGCVLLGKHFGYLRGDRAVLNSGRTFAEFLQRVQGVEAFPFIVDEACGEGAWNTSA